MKDALLLDDELMEGISGGYNVDDLSPEDLAELQRLGGLLVEMQIMKRNNDPDFSKERYLEVLNEINALDKVYREKYGA